MGDTLRVRATHAPHRANLRCLGLSVGIAIALAGCDRAPEEAASHRYVVAYDRCLSREIGESAYPSDDVVRRCKIEAAEMAR